MRSKILEIWGVTASFKPLFIGSYIIWFLECIHNSTNLNIEALPAAIYMHKKTSCKSKSWLKSTVNSAFSTFFVALVQLWNSLFCPVIASMPLWSYQPLLHVWSWLNFDAGGPTREINVVSNKWSTNNRFLSLLQVLFIVLKPRSQSLLLIGREFITD